MTGAPDGGRASKLSAKAVNPKSPAAFFAAQEHSVQKSAKSEPGRKIRSVSADVPGALEHRLSGSQTPLQDAEVSGKSYKARTGSPVPASPKGHAVAPLKVQSRGSSGRETPTTGRSQVNEAFAAIDLSMPMLVTGKLQYDRICQGLQLAVKGCS